MLFVKDTNILPQCAPFLKILPQCNSPILCTAVLQALVDLYFFKEANPAQDIESMLSSASATFKNFIMRGLHKVCIGWGGGGRPGGSEGVQKVCHVCVLGGGQKATWAEGGSKR